MRSRFTGNQASPIPSPGLTQELQTWGTFKTLPFYSFALRLHLFTCFSLGSGSAVLRLESEASGRVESLSVSGQKMW